jgi:hypothetical protein
LADEFCKQNNLPYEEKLQPGLELTAETTAPNQAEIEARLGSLTFQAIRSATEFGIFG